MRIALRTCLLVASSSLCLLAGDLTITFKASTKGLMGSTTEGTQISYYSTNFHKEVNEASKIDTLVDYEKGVIYTIKHKDKKIEMMTFEDLAALADAMAKRLEKMPDFMKNMMGGGDQGEMQVEQTGTDTVAGRPCKKFKLTMGKMLDELSVDPSLKPPMNPAAYAKFMKLRANGIPGASGTTMKKLYEELGKLKGIPLRTHLSGLMGMDSSTEATEVKTSEIPASVFTLPTDYKTEDQGKKLLKNMK